jgi:DNA-binding SARP family transcriptional activator
MGQPVEIRVLGELEVRRDGAAVELPPSRKTRAVLGLLAVQGAPVLRSRLCDLLWDGADDPRGLLRWSLCRLRAAVGDVLQADREHVWLDTRSASCDLVLVRAQVPPDLRAPTSALELAAPLFRGDLLEGLELPDCDGFQVWCLAQRCALRQLRGALHAELAARHAADPARALIWARARLELEPYSEPAHVAVVRLLASLDRTREGLLHFEACKRMLRNEYGVDPSAELLRARSALGAGLREAGARTAAVGARPARHRPALRAMRVAR